MVGTRVAVTHYRYLHDNRVRLITDDLRELTLRKATTLLPKDRGGGRWLAKLRGFY